MVRKHTLIEVIVAGGLAAIGLATGQSVLFSLVADVGGNWLASLAQNGLSHWQRNWLTENGVLNGDIARLLCRALNDALRQLERDWKQHRHYQQLARIDPEQAKLTLDSLRTLHEASTRLFEDAPQYDVIVHAEGIPLLLNNDVSGLQALIADTLSAYLYGHDEEFVNFIRDQLADQWLLRFGEGLKDPGEEGTRAWRAIQRLWQESLTVGINELKHTTEETLAVARWLQEWAEKLDQLPDNERDSTGLRALETVIAQIRLHLEDITSTTARLEAGQERIVGSTNRIGVGIEELLARVQPIQPPFGVYLDDDLPIVCPYAGMVPYGTESSHLFYGRDTHVQKMLMHLRHRSFLLVVGASASGKSSLLNAGLLPALQRSSYWPQGFWSVLSMRPGAEPMSTLCKLLETDTIHDVKLTIAEYLNKHQSSKQLLIVIDQLEELFTQNEHAQQRQFIALLNKIALSGSCALVFALRADFYHDLMVSDLWPVDVSDRMEITPLRGEELRSAIEQPATDVGVYIEGGLLERLLNDASDEPGSLPLLQETLVLLWEQRKGRMLTLEAYDRLGGKTRSGLAVAVAHKADAVFASLAAEQQRITRRVLLRLIQFGEGRPDTRRQQLVHELRVAAENFSLFDSTLALLASHRLLIMGESRDGHFTTVDLAHEILISGWPLLNQWVTERRDAEQMRRRLEEKASEWVRLGKGRSGLLDEGELSEAERWLVAVEANDLGCSETLLMLMQWSRAQIARTRQQEYEAQERSRAARRMGRIAFVLSLVVLLVGAAASVAAISWREADSQRATAQQEASARGTAQAQAEQLSRTVRAQGIAANAIAQLDNDPELGLLLAMEAVSETIEVGEAPAPQSEDALHKALATSRVRLTLRDFSDNVNSAAFSPDGQSIVTASSDGKTVVWDATTGEKRWEVTAFTSVITDEFGLPQTFTVPVSNAIYSPDGRFIATSGGDHITIWDAVSGYRQSDLKVLDPFWSDSSFYTGLGDISYSSDGRLIAVAGGDSIQIWDVISGVVIQTLSAPLVGWERTDVVNTVRFSPDGKQVVAAVNGSTLLNESDGQETRTHEGAIFIWEVDTGHLAGLLIPQESRGAFESAVYSPDGAYIVTVNRDMAQRWDAQTRILVRSWPVDAERVAFSPDGNTILTNGGSGGSDVRLWEAYSGYEVTILRGHSKWLTSVGWSTDGRFVVTASADRSVKVWEVATSDERQTSFADADDVRSLSVSPDGRFIVGASSDESRAVAKVWEVETGKEIMKLCCHTGWVMTAEFSPDGSTIVTAGEDGVAKTWDAKTGQQILVLGGHKDGLNTATYSKDGRLITTSSRDGTAIIWDAATGRELLVLRPEGGIDQAIFSPDSRFVLTVGGNNGAEVWDAKSGNRVLVLPEAQNCATYSPDGRYIAAAAEGERLPNDASIEYNLGIIWDAITGEEVARLQGSNSSITSISYSADGRFIVTGENLENGVKIWDSSTGQERISLHIPAAFERQGVTYGSDGAAFSPDGRLVFELSDKLHQYIFDTHELMQLAATRVTRSLTSRERATYLGEAMP